MDNDERIRRAERAKILLGEEVFVEAWAALESAAIARLRRTDDPQEREVMCLRLKVIDDLKADLAKIVEAGRIAADQNDKADKNDRARKAYGLAPGDVP